MQVIKIGRSSSNDVVVNDLTVSLQHAIITVSDAGIINIKDLNSKNGTFVNGICIQDTMQLSANDKVKLGNTNVDWLKMIQISEKTVTSSKIQQPVVPANVKEQRIIGRTSNAHIRFDYDDVSKNHAILCRCDNDDIVIIDNNSTNGTYVNGNRVTSRVLKKGDVVSISSTHTLQWEGVYSSKRKNYIWRWAVCALMSVLIIGVGVWLYCMQRPLAPEKIYAKYQKSVVVIFQKSAYVATVKGELLGEYLGSDLWNYFAVDAEDKVRQGLTEATGTGFFISNDGKIMTNKHVVAPMGGEKEQADKVKKAIQVELIRMGLNRQIVQMLVNDLEVKHQLFYVGIALNDTHVNSPDDLIPCSIYKISDDDKIDIAILQVNSKKTPSEVVSLVDLKNIASPEELETGKKVYTIGFPQTFILGETEMGMEANNQSGEITQQRGEYQYGHNITVHQGASGSPVFNDRGKFAGVIVSGYLGLSQGYNQAIQPKSAAELAK